MLWAFGRCFGQRKGRASSNSRTLDSAQVQRLNNCCGKAQATVSASFDNIMCISDAAGGSRRYDHGRACYCDSVEGANGCSSIFTTTQTTQTGRWGEAEDLPQIPEHVPGQPPHVGTSGNTTSTRRCADVVVAADTAADDQQERHSADSNAVNYFFQDLECSLKDSFGNMSRMSTFSFTSKEVEDPLMHLLPVSYAQ